MAENIKRHITHIKSKVVEEGSPKLPASSQIELGELAINYAKGYETLSIKNESGDVVTFKSDNQLTGIVQTQIDNSISGKVNTSDIVSAITPSNSASTAPIATKVVAENELVMTNALNSLDDRFGGLRLVKISQTDYDNLTTKDSNTLYIITD